ncbi:hypothetical protein F5H01DRAFT_385220 [Linnemannia elongata]|nr:hypothetical protein F5H01DRAFT_385220 [Linnemannia elongata]
MTSRAYALRLTRTSSSRTLGTTTRTGNCSAYILADKSCSTIPTRRVLSTYRHYTSSSQRYPATPLLTSTSASSTARHQQHQLLTRTRIQPSAYFCTHPAFRQLQSASSTSANQQQQNTEEHSKELKALVGLPCPGCGSAFQISHPQEPGYLTRLLDGPHASSSATLEKGKGKGKKGKKTAPVVAEGATTMSHDQYEAYLERLDPKLLQEMGILPPPPPSDPVAEGGEEGTGSAMDAGAGSESGSSERPSAAAGEAEQVVEVLDRKPSRTSSTQPARIVCHRCHSLSHHASPLANSSILPSSMFPSPPAPVPKHLETLAQSKTSTVVLVVDLIDFPLSLPQPIIQELLKSKKQKKSATTGAGATEAGKKDYPTTPIILVGNKFDVMPSSTRKQTIIQNIQSYLTSHGLDDNVRAIHLVSAKNPEGDEIRMLLKSIGTAWTKSGKGNVVMVGGENVGKSQLVNAFLKEGGRWRVSGVQVEREKFGAEKAERQKKLSLLLGTSSTASDPEEDTDRDNEEDKEWAAMTGKDSVGADMDKYEALYKDRGQEKLAKYQTTVSNVPGTTLERIKVPLSVLSRFMGATYKEVQTKWLMDTPGIRPAAGQLTSWLTLEELKVALPKKVLKPVSFTLEEGKSFFLGGLVRIDCLSIGKPTLLPFTTSEDPTTPPPPLRRPRGSNPAPKLTIFTTLPLHKTSTPGADKFLEKINSGQLTILQPPFGTPERLAAFPGLKPVSSKDIVIVNRAPSPSSFSSSSSSSSDSLDPFARLSGDSSPFARFDQESSPLTRRERETAALQYAGQYGICDLVFSGIGWVMISGKFHGDDQAVRLKVWTPQGQGAMVREPALLPDLAGQQIEKTSGGVRGKGRQGQGRKVFQALPLSPSSSSEE